jgi:hypothetical protein
MHVRRSDRLPFVGLLVPVAMLGLGVGLLRAFAAEPERACLARDVGDAAPCRGRGLGLRLAAAVAGSRSFHVALSRCLAVLVVGRSGCRSRGAWVAPPRAIGAGLVVLAVVDVILVWGTRQVASATTVLARATLPTLALPLLPHRPLPALQPATFGSASMGWLDLLAPALLCAAFRPRPSARGDCNRGGQPALGVSCSSSRRRSLRRFSRRPPRRRRGSAANGNGKRRIASPSHSWTKEITRSFRRSALFAATSATTEWSRRRFPRLSVGFTIRRLEARQYSCRVFVRRGLGGSGSWLSPSPTSRSGLWWAHSFGVAGAWA